MYPAENTLIELSDSQQRSVLHFWDRGAPVASRLQVVCRCVRKGWGTEAEGLSVATRIPKTVTGNVLAHLHTMGKGR